MGDFDRETARQDIEDFIDALIAMNKIQQAMYKRMLEIRNEMEG